MNLIEQKCVVCEGGLNPFTKKEAEELLEQINGWELGSDSKSISKKYTFKNFIEALAFVNKVGKIAENEGHHPDIHLFDYKYVKIEISTHSIGGLSQNDFIVASKIDK